MASPHPSYPPLDLAAAGAVVVTNRFDGKFSLDRYSEDIISSDPTVAALKQAIATAVVRSMEPDRPHRRNHLLRDWNVAFRPVLERFFATPGNSA